MVVKLNWQGVQEKSGAPETTCNLYFENDYISG